MMIKSRECVWVMIKNKFGNLYNFGSNRLKPDMDMGWDCPDREILVPVPIRNDLSQNDEILLDR